MNPFMLREIGDRADVREIAGRIHASRECDFDMNETIRLVQTAYEHEEQYLREKGAGDGKKAPYDEEEAFDYILDRMMAGNQGLSNDALARVVDDYIACQNEILEIQGKLSWCPLAKGA